MRQSNRRKSSWTDTPLEDREAEPRRNALIKIARIDMPFRTFPSDHCPASRSHHPRDRDRTRNNLDRDRARATRSLLRCSTNSHPGRVLLVPRVLIVAVLPRLPVPPSLRSFPSLWNTDLPFDETIQVRPRPSKIRPPAAATVATAETKGSILKRALAQAGVGVET